MLRCSKQWNKRQVTKLKWKFRDKIEMRIIDGLALKIQQTPCYTWLLHAWNSLKWINCV